MGRHYSWLIDPTTGDYTQAKGSPVRDESLQFPAYLRIKVKRGAWLYAPNADYGSDLSALKKRAETAGQLASNIAERALQPLIDDGRATLVEVSTVGIARHGLELLCDITDSNSNRLSFTLSPVGV